MTNESNKGRKSREYLVPDVVKHAIQCPQDDHAIRQPLILKADVFSHFEQHIIFGVRGVYDAVPHQFSAFLEYSPVRVAEVRDLDLMTESHLSQARDC